MRWFRRRLRRGRRASRRRFERLGQRGRASGSHLGARHWPGADSGALLVRCPAHGAAPFDGDRPVGRRGPRESPPRLDETVVILHLGCLALAIQAIRRALHRCPPSQLRFLRSGRVGDVRRSAPTFRGAGERDSIARIRVWTHAAAGASCQRILCSRDVRHTQRRRSTCQFAFGG